MNGDAEPASVLPAPGVAAALRRGLRSPVPYLVLAVFLFAAGFTELTFLRLDSFHSSINDLGAFNQIYWVTLHGGPAAWEANQAETFYASYPWQSLILVVLLPAYALAPGPETLLVGQGIAVPLAAVPLYLLARRYGFPPWVSFGFAGLYLINYQVEGAALNDYHLQVFFPVLFFAMVLAYESGWKWTFGVFAGLAMTVNPLTLAIVLAFLVAKALGPRVRPVTATLTRVLRRFGDPRSPELWVLLLGLVLVAGELLTGSIAGYHVGASASGTGTSPYSSTVGLRLLYLGMTFVPFLGVAFLDRQSLVTSLPLLAFLAVADTSYFKFFGHQDAFEYLAVGLWGLLLFAREGRAHLDAVLLHRWAPRRAARAPRPGRRPLVLLGCALAVSVLLFLSFSPISPVNNQPAYLGAVNELPGQLTSVTPADRFLQETIDVVPAGASVLTQNNVVQLTGRPVFNWAFPTKTGTIDPLNYTFIIADDSQDTVAQFWYAYLAPYVAEATRSGAFGTFSIGYGILGLEKGFRGPPLLVGPTSFPARTLPLYSGRLVGGVAIHPAANNFAFWYGPYLDLPAGNYTITYELKVANVTSFAAPILELAVYTFSNGTVHAFRSLLLTGNSFSAQGSWQSFALGFTLVAPAAALEFGGLYPTQVSTIYFSGETLTVDQLA